MGVRNLIKLAMVIGTSLFLVGIVSFVVFWVGNGRVIIHPPEGSDVEQISYCAVDACPVMEHASAKESLTIPKGDYTVNITLDNNSNYVKNVTVGGFLAKAEIDVKSYKFSPSTLEGVDKQYVIPLNGGYVTYNQDDTAKPLGNAAQLQLDIRPLSAAKYVDENNVVLIYGTHAQDENNTVNAYASLYNTNSGAVSKIGDIDVTTSAQNTYYSSNAVYVVSAIDKTITKISADGIVTKSLPMQYSMNGSRPIVAFGKDFMAVISGNDYSPPIDDGEVEAPKPIASLITVYKISDFSKITEIDVGQRNDISDISLSPNDAWITITAKSNLISYNLKTGKKILSTPSTITESEHLVWSDDHSYLYQNGVTGLYRADLETKESYSIVDNSLLIVDYISCVIGEKVYLTASPNNPNSNTRMSQGGYTIDLSSDTSNTTVIDSDSLVRVLPYNGATFTIGYHFEKGKPVIDVDARAGSRNTAISMIYSLNQDPSDYMIIFNNYTNPFRKEGSR